VLTGRKKSLGSLGYLDFIMFFRLSQLCCLPEAVCGVDLSWIKDNLKSLLIHPY
jgi:hypothetical protein